MFPLLTAPIRDIQYVNTLNHNPMYFITTVTQWKLSLSQHRYWYHRVQAWCILHSSLRCDRPGSARAGTLTYIYTYVLVSKPTSTTVDRAIAPVGRSFGLSIRSPTTRPGNHDQPDLIFSKLRLKSPLACPTFLLLLLSPFLSQGCLPDLLRFFLARPLRRERLFLRRVLTTNPIVRAKRRTASGGERAFVLSYVRRCTLHSTCVTSRVAAAAVRSETLGHSFLVDYSSGACVRTRRRKKLIGSANKRQTSSRDDRLNADSINRSVFHRSLLLQ